MIAEKSNSAEGKSLAVFFVLAYGLSWAVEIPLALRAHGLISAPIPWSLHYLSGYGPLLAAIIVTGITSGRAGLRELFGRVFKWRVRPVWWLVAFAPILLYALSAVVLIFFRGSGSSLAALGQIDFLPNLGAGALLVWFLTFGLGEETGWRGFALPRLQRGRSAFSATVILWVLWALWHLPLFFYLYDPTIIVGFLLGLLAGAIVFTWLCNSTGGSVLLLAVWHAAFDFVTGCVACKTGVAAAVVSTLVMVWAVGVVVLVWFKPTRLSSVKKEVMGGGNIAKRLNWIGLFCAVLATAFLLGACAPTPTPTPAVSAVGPTVEPSPVGLSATLEAPSSLPDGKAVVLNFTLTNHSPEQLYVLTWHTPLEGVFGEIFGVERDGVAIPYEGPLVMRGDPLPENYVLLDPGASVSAEVDLATVYDFSQPGDYTIQFLSPKISHVAKTEDEFAASVDDLGPVEIPCSPITVRIGDSTASATRRTLAEAAEMIRDYLQGQHLQLNPDVRLPLEELPVPEAWDLLRVQLFRITEGPFANESFLVGGESLLGLGEATGGSGLISLEISDLDGDGIAELLFTYAFGSGLHQSRIGMYAPAYGTGRAYEAGIGYLGDLGLVKEDQATVQVRVVESDEAALTLRYLDLLGSLAIEVHSNQPKLVLNLAKDLPDNVRDRVFSVTS